MRALALTIMLATAAACSKKVEPPRRTEPWLRTPTASGVPAESVGTPELFKFTSESQVRFSLPARRGRPGGSVRVSGGELLVNRSQLEKSRATVEVDLRELRIDPSTLPEDAELGGREPSQLALDWLELGADVPRDRAEQVARARFELVSVENLSSPGIEPAGRGRRVRATIVGTLLLHGFRAPVRCDVWIENAAGESGAASRLSIQSATPVVLALGPHDITARTPSGIPDPLAAARAAEWVGKSARIELTLLAERQERNSK